MKSEHLESIAVTIIASLLIWHVTHQNTPPSPDQAVPRVRRPEPDGGKRRHPFRPLSAIDTANLATGGPRNVDGAEVMCDLPVDQRTPNTGGTDGAGLCVFTSIGHAARWQNDPRLANLQRDMTHEPGGGYPEKVDAMLKKYGQGITPRDYVNIETNDPEILHEAIDSGRMPCVTYNGHDPHYRGSIAHMVNLVALDARHACILDNNFVGQNDLVWMSPTDFYKRWKGGAKGWVVILLSPAPPPVPRN
jgi:hypothetical protein